MALERFLATLLTREPFSRREAVVCLLILRSKLPPSRALPAARSPHCRLPPRALPSTSIAGHADPPAASVSCRAWPGE
jgi:hypothetical protein